MITIDTFMAVELRVAKVLAAEPVPGSRKLMQLEVTLGSEERQIIAGILGYYQTADLVGKKIVVVANLQPAKLMGRESQGMLLAADVGGKPVVLFVPDHVPEGSRVR